jgi:hypothetical protein
VVILRTLCLIGCECRVRPGNAQRSCTLLECQAAIGQRVDLEKEAALGDAHILDDGDLNDAAANSGGDMDHTCIDRTIARCRVIVALVERVKRERDSKGDYRDRDQSAARPSVRFARNLHLQCPKPIARLIGPQRIPVATDRCHPH